MGAQGRQAGSHAARSRNVLGVPVTHPFQPRGILLLGAQPQQLNPVPGAPVWFSVAHVLSGTRVPPYGICKRGVFAGVCVWFGGVQCGGRGVPRGNEVKGDG